MEQDDMLEIAAWPEEILVLLLRAHKSATPVGMLVAADLETLTE
jgi:hypothetical protein